MEANSSIKTLYLIGPSSTGKSTLFHAIVKDMGLDPGQGITEVARTVMKRNTSFSRKTVGCANFPFPSIRNQYPMSNRDIEMQRTILKAQLEQEQSARSVAGGSAVRIVLSDRSAIDPVAYAVLTAANEEDGRERMRVLVDTPEFQTALRWYREGTFVLFKPVPEWLVDDGVRSMDEKAQTIGVYRNILKGLEISYVELGEEIKDLQARVAFAKGLINANGTSACSRETESKCSYHGPWQRRKFDDDKTPGAKSRFEHSLVAVIVDGEVLSTTTATNPCRYKKHELE